MWKRKKRKKERGLRLTLAQGLARESETRGGGKRDGKRECGRDMKVKVKVKVKG
jgi:hypothetical protein